MRDFWLTIFAAVVSSLLTAGGVVFAAVRYFLSNYVEHRFEIRRLEFQNSLQSEKDKAIGEIQLQHQLAIERLRSDMGIEAASHQIQFARLNELLAEVIAETYAKLVAFHRSVGEFVTPWGALKDDKRMNALGEANAKYRQLKDYIDAKGVYFPEATLLKVHRLLTKLRDLGSDFEHRVRVDRGRQEPEAWDQVLRVLDDEVPPMLVELRAEFRSLLGHRWIPQGSIPNKQGPPI